jgi:hypothetical protein
VLVVALTHVVHLRAMAGEAHRQVVLGTVTLALGALAAGFAAAQIPLDERAPEQLFHGRQRAQEPSSTTAQAGSGFLLYPWRNIDLTVPIV